MHRGGAPAFLVVWLAASRAFAEPTPPLTEPGEVTLKWNAPAECPTSASVLAQIERNVGAAKFARADVEANVSALGPRRWSVHLVTNVDSAHGERSLEANTCAALADATALIVALTIAPAHDDVTPTPTTAPEPAKLKPIETPEDREAAPSPKSRLTGLVAVTLLGDLGTLPHAGVAPGITIGMMFEIFRAEISGNTWFTQDARSPLSNSEGSHLQLLDLAARGCFRIPFRSIEIAPCLGAGLVHLSIAGFGETFPEQTDDWWLTARVDLVATWTIVDPIAIRALVGAVAPFQRDAVDFEDSQGDRVELHRPALISGQAAIGVEAHFR
ncbi:MAG: hypothetical protein ABI183_13040 [Polyangiaceae bacterium]